MGTNCGRSFMKLCIVLCVWVWIITPDENSSFRALSLGGGKKKPHDTQQSFKSHNYKLLQVEHNKKTEFYVGKGNVTMQKPTYSFRRIIHELHHGS